MGIWAYDTYLVDGEQHGGPEPCSMYVVCRIEYIGVVSVYIQYNCV
jgi:hypothetical protein